MADVFVTLKTYPDPIEAEMAAEFLRAHEIDAEVADAATQSAITGAGNILFSVRLLVPRSRALEAQKLLQEAAEAKVVTLPSDPAEENLATPAATMAPHPEPPSLPHGMDGYLDRTWNERERSAEKAYRALVMGWYIPLIWIWGAAHLVVVMFKHDSLRPSQRRHATIAACILGGRLTFYLLIAVLVVREFLLQDS